MHPNTTDNAQAPQVSPEAVAPPTNTEKAIKIDNENQAIKDNPPKVTPMIVQTVRKDREEMRSFTLGQYVIINEDGIVHDEPSLHIEPCGIWPDGTVKLVVLDRRPGLGVVVEPSVGGYYLLLSPIGLGTTL